jgi:hypothetical protein
MFLSICFHKVIKSKPLGIFKIFFFPVEADAMQILKMYKLLLNAVIKLHKFKISQNPSSVQNY